MNKFIDYYYAPISGYAYLGEQKLVAIAKQADASIRFKPVDIAQVFARSDTTAPFKQSEARLNYRFRDMQRIAEKAGLAINPKPKHWPVPVDLAATTIYAAIDLGHNAHLVSFSLLSAVYAQERNIADEQTIHKLLTELGLDAAKILQHRNSDSISQQYTEATAAAIQLGIFGSPSYVAGEELFFGQDRLDMLAEFLSK